MNQPIIYRTGPTRNHRWYDTYEQARAHAQDGGVWVDLGPQGAPRGHRRPFELPPEPFSYQIRRGDVIELFHALGGRLRSGDGRQVLEPVHPWVFVNTTHRTVEVVVPRRQRDQVAA